MTDDRRARWNARYAEDNEVWRTEPDATIVSIVRGWPPGRALDLAAGEGRHAIWLADRGWQVTAVDYSSTGIANARAAAGNRDIGWVVADVTQWEPPGGTAYDLIVIAFLHIPDAVFDRVAAWLAPGGALVVVAHSLRNLDEGVGGPSDPSLLYTPDTLRASVPRLEVERCDEVERPRDERTAVDVVLVARRPS